MFLEIDQLNKDVWQSGTNDPPAGLKKAKNALELSIENDYPEGLADSFLNIGRCQVFISELDVAQANLNKALDIYREQSGERSEIGELRTLNALGVVSFELEEYENALNYYFMALTEAELNRNDEVRILALNNIGEIHRLLNNKEEALGYFHQAYQFAEDLKIARNIGTTSINLGELYLLLEDLTEAEGYFKSALIIAGEHNYQQMKADALLGLGKILLQNRDQHAETKISEAGEIFSKIGDRISNNACRFQLGLLELQRKNYDEAERIISSVCTAADELKHSDLQSRCFLGLSEIYKHKNKYKEALENYEKYTDLVSSLGNESLKNRLKKITILYETEQTVTEKEVYRMQSLNLEKSNKEIEFINKIGQQITATLELDEIIYNTFTRIAEIIDISSFGVALYDENADEIFFTNIIEEGEKLAPFKISTDSETSLAAYCILNKTPLLINEEKESEKYIKHWSEGRTGVLINSAIFMPMQQRGRMVGCLTIQNTEKNM